MKPSRFPDPRDAGPEGLLCVGGELSEELLLDAYSHGIFPWPQEGYPMLWFSPDQRGVLDFAHYHTARSFQRFLRNTALTVSFDRAFERVIAECARAPRPGQAGSWITPEICAAYAQMHKLGHAHSVECWSGDQLVGGLYGTYVAGVFSAESMFYHLPNASKVCLHTLVRSLSQQGLTWIDIQMVSDITARVGGIYVSRDEFMRRLQKSRAHPIALEFKRTILPIQI